MQRFLPSLQNVLKLTRLTPLLDCLKVFSMKLSKFTRLGVIAALCSSLWACGDEDEKNEFVNNMLGIWDLGATDGCIDLYDSNNEAVSGVKQRYQMTLEADGDNYTYSVANTVYTGTTCETANIFFNLTYSGKFAVGEESDIDLDPVGREMTNTIETYSATFSTDNAITKANASDYQTGGFCGLTTWVKDTATDVTGRTCQWFDATAKTGEKDVIQVSSDGLMLYNGKRKQPWGGFGGTTDDDGFPTAMETTARLIWHKQS